MKATDLATKSGGERSRLQVPSGERRLLTVFATLAVLWTAICGSSLAWNIRHHRLATLNLARAGARTILHRDLLYRHWAAGHGGVYVPVTETTLPNPYLTNVVERDLLTPTGRRLTLVNPAYMTRQVHELGLKEGEFRGHITSLNPIRLENAADTWETNALRTFERGEKEFSSVEVIAGQPRLRLMVAMVTERGCLKCHAAQGYKEGDIRGGLGISVPLNTYTASAQTVERADLQAHGLIWLLGLGGLGGGTFFLRRRTRDRDAAVSSLQTVEAELEDFYQNAPDMFCSVDSATGKIVACNQAFAGKLGRQRDKILGRPIFEVYHAESVARAREAFAQFQRSGEIRNVELQLLNQEGKCIDIELSATAIRDTHGQIVRSRSVLRDVTEQNQMAQALRASEARFRQLFERAPVAYQSLDAEGRIQEVNPAWLHMLGYTQEEVVGRSMAEFLRPEHAVLLNQRFPQFKAKGEIHGSEFDFRRKDGSLVTVSVEGRAGYDQAGQFHQAHCMLYDVTERQRAHEELQQSEARYRLLFDEGTEGIAVADCETGILLDCNKAMLGITGWEKSELIGQPQTVLHPPEDRREGASESFQAHRGTKAGQVLEARFLTKSGEIKFVEVKATVLELNGRKVVQGFFRDVTQRKQTESALHEEEERYRLLFNGITDAVFVHGIRDDDLPGAFIAVNETLCRRLSYSREELLRMTVLDIDAPESSVDRTVIIRKLKQGESVLFEQMHVAKDGRRIPVEIHVQMFLLQRRPLVLSVARDITDRKQAERALVESEAQLRLVWEKSQDGMRLTDADGIVRRVNPAYCRMMGQPPEALEGRPFTVVYDPMCHPTSLELFRRRFRDRSISEHFEQTMTLWNGKPISIELSSAFLAVPGLPELVLNVIRDITARRQIEEALHESENLLRESQHAAGLGSYVLNIPTGIWRSSDVLDKLLGIDETYEHSVAGWAALIHPDDRTMMVDYFNNEVVGQRQTFDKEYRIQRHDNQAERWVHGMGRLEFDAQGQPLKMHGTIQDITDRKQAEQAHAQLEAQLRQSQKMEAIGQLAGGVAHDFNNILTVIVGSADLLTAEPELAKENRELAEQISEAAHRAANLTRQLLAFSRKQIMQVRPLDLNEVLGQVLKMLQRVLGENIMLNCAYAPDLPAAKADAAMLEQVIMNLAVNARDAMPKGGRLFITTGVCEVGPEQAQRNAEAHAGRFVTLAIADTGCGMDANTLAHIFEPFFTTKEVGKGTGLGLATVYGIIKQHGGWVEVTTEPGHGTTFTVFLPATAEASSNSAGKAPVEEVAGGNETILLVEDDASVRHLVRTCLRRYGYRILEATHGVEALRVWQEHGGQVDLLLTDVVMPEGMNGREVAEALLRHKPQLKVIFSSGYDRDALSSEFANPPGSSFLAKPYHPVTLAKTVRACLDNE